jgi:hypothetical protein
MGDHDYTSEDLSDKLPLIAKSRDIRIRIFCKFRNELKVALARVKEFIEKPSIADDDPPF